ncbi:hypothetical protein Bca4012_080630 [Brassica carinata]
MSSLENIKNETVDLEKVPIEEVFQQLKCTKEGLTTQEGEARVQIFGLNKLEEKKVLRDGKWSEQEAAILVPGDIVSIKLGDIIPADARLLEGDPLKVDQSALTGESLPVTKHPGQGVFSGSTCKQGEIEAVVIATGVHTFFGKAAHLVDSTNQVGHFQKVLTAIGNFCICSIAIGMVIEILVMYPIQRRKYRDGIDNLLVLLIGGIPIAMPTVLSVTMAIGSHKLAQQGAITKRMTAIEEMAGMDVLCSDKTGTLTLNKLSVDKNLVEVFCKGVEKDQVLLFAAMASRIENQDAIDAAMVGMLADPKEARAGIREVHFLPFNPTDKRTALTYIDSSGNWHRVSKGDQLAIGKETGRRLGMGTNMYPSSALLGNHKDPALANIPVEDLIEQADGFAGVFPEHKYEIVKKLQERKHIVGMTGDGVNDAPALKKADIGIAVDDATDAARGASDIVLTEPGLSVIISAVLTSRAIFQRMKNYTIYAVSITIRIVLGFMLIALIWKFDFSAFMVLIIAILNDGTIMTISKDRVTPSPTPDSWKLREIFATGVVLGSYLAVMTVVFFWLANETDFFSNVFGVRSIKGNEHELMSALYLQVSIISQALIFVTRSRSWSFVERPGALLMIAFLIAQLVATLIAVYANWEFAEVRGIGWGWAGVIWLYSIITYFPLDILKFAIRYILSGKAWLNMTENRTALTTKKDFGKEEREAQWAVAQRTLHGLQPKEPVHIIPEQGTYRELSEIAEQAKRRAEIARLRELHTLKGHVESVAKLKGLDIETPGHYTV